MMKECGTCHEVKSEKEFPKSGYKSTVTGKASRRGWCKVCYDAYRTTWREKNAVELGIKWANYRRALKLRVLTHYSGGKEPFCVCCRETTNFFLTLDHINNGGAEDRIKYGEGSTFYLSLVRRGFPEGFQVLCSNCNLGKQINKGFCPHRPEIDLRKGSNNES